MKKTLMLVLAVVVIVLLGGIFLTSNMNDDGFEITTVEVMSEEMMVEKLGHVHPTLDMDVIDSMEVEPGYVVLQVNGFVCDVCAKKTKAALIMLPFIDDVMVDTKNQLVSIKIQDMEMLDLEAVANTIKAKGFNPYMAYMIDEDGEQVKQRL